MRYPGDAAIDYGFRGRDMRRYRTMPRLSRRATKL